EVLPPGVVDVSGPINNAAGKGYQFSWMAQILPYIEQKNIYNGLNFKTGVYDTANTTARDMMINSFLCPSDPRMVRESGAPSSFPGCNHDVKAPIDADNHGLFFLNSAIRSEQIPDGRSQTILIAEKIAEPDMGWASGTRSTLRNTGMLPNAGPRPGA